MPVKKRPRALDFTPQEKKSLSAYERWELPALLDSEIEIQHQAELAQRRQEIIDELNLPTAEEFEQIRKEAFKDGFKEGKEAGLRKGYEKGLKNGQAEIDAVLARMSQVMRTLSQPIPINDQRVEDKLIEFVLTFCKHIIGRELIVDSTVIGSVIEDIIKIINLEQKIKIFLNPKDADLIIEVLENKALLDDNWQIIHRESITPGGCVVDTIESHIEGSVEKRIADLTDCMYQNMSALESVSAEDLFSELQGYGQKAAERSIPSPETEEKSASTVPPGVDEAPKEEGQPHDLSSFESDLADTLEEFHEPEQNDANDNVENNDNIESNERNENNNTLKNDVTEIASMDKNESLSEDAEANAEEISLDDSKNTAKDTSNQSAGNDSDEGPAEETPPGNQSE